MSRVYNAYLSDDERLIAVESARMDLQFARYNVMLEMIDQKLDLNKKAAELKVLEESGTYDDLEYLYMEAENEAGQEKTGVIQSICNAIKTVIQSISNAIKNFVNKNKANTNAEVEVDATEYDNANKLINGWNNVKKAINLPDNNSGKFDAIVKAVGGLVGGFVVVQGANKVYKKVKYGDVNDKITKVDQINQEILNFVNNSILGKIANTAKDVLGKFSNVLNPVQDLINKVKNILVGLKVKITKPGEKDETATDENTGKAGTVDTNTDQTGDVQPAKETTDTKTGENNTGTTESVEEDDSKEEVKESTNEDDEENDKIYGLDPSDFLEESVDDSINEIMEILGEL